MTNRRAGENSTDSVAVEIDTGTGRISHRPPIALDRDTFDSKKVREILSSAESSTPTMSVAARRKANQLLGLEADGRYLYPRFQFEPSLKSLSVLAVYANEAMECDLDPWGMLDWWFTEDDCIARQRPAARLATGTLS